MPQCPRLSSQTTYQWGEICHIKARSKKGPCCDASLTQAEKDDYPNLLLLCRTCHKLVDSDETTYTSELLTNIMNSHEKGEDWKSPRRSPVRLKPCSNCGRDAERPPKATAAVSQSR